MISKIKKLKRQTVFADTPNIGYYKPVVSKLATTPSDVAKLSERGIAVNSSNVGSFVDGVQNPSFSLPVDQLRGVDVVDVWNQAESARSKLRKASVNDVNNSSNG